VTLGEAFPALLAAAREGADWAWEEIFRELSGPVRGYVAARGAAEPEDVAAEAFLDVARGIAEFEGDEGQFRSWVFVIAHRRMLDARRSRTRRPAVVDHDVTELALSLRGGDVEDEALARQSVDDARALIDGLTPEQQDVLLLRVVAGLSVRETAVALDKSEGAVKALQNRALESLRRDVDRNQSAADGDYKGEE
jgi:RNA polymerase sigma-70 factor (ECF subfamily)